MARKGENIFKRKDGRWEARYIHHYDSAERAVYAFVYGRSYSEAKEKRREKIAKQEPILSPTKEVSSLEELCAHWLADVKISVKESTFAQYYRLANNYILPGLNDVPLGKLNAKTVNAFSEKLLQNGGKFGNGLSAKTVTDILTVLKSILKFGVQNEYLTSSIEGLRYPGREGKQVEILTEENRKTLERVLNEGEGATEMGILLSLFTGMRIGEVCGLTWQDVDWKSRIINVRRTVERIKNMDADAQERTKIIICEPKTASSVRVIPIPRFLFARLREYHQKSLAGGCRAGDFILSGSEKPMEPGTLYNRYKKIMRRHNMDKYTFHALRHTFATRCVEAGFDTKSLSEILGHSNIATTLSIYVHPSLAQKRRQMDKLCPF